MFQESPLFRPIMVDSLSPYYVNFNNEISGGKSLARSNGTCLLEGVFNKTQYIWSEMILYLVHV